ncbi:MAG: glycosyltransferase family 4 protein [Bacteroidales bacterium]|nr:glycosyltransferase family 4 protein [Bacteroidales bacterium]
MNIGVNTRLLIDGKLEGIGWFTKQILENMVVKHREHKFYFFFDRKYSKKFVFSKNVIPIIIPVPARSPLLWHIYFDMLLPLYCRIYKIDVFFSPENYIPKNIKKPVICTVHDINFIHNPQYIGNALHRKYFLKYFGLNARKSDKVITVSNFSKKDISENMNVSEEKIEVVYNAANDCYKPLPKENREQTLQQIKQKYTKGRDYFYFVGSISKRKNLQGLFKAFDVFKQRNENDIQLVIIGNAKWWDEEIEKAYSGMKYKEDVILLGRLSSEETALITSASIALVFVSLFEGFGIPIVEAFQTGTSVITSNLTSMPEIAEDAAIVVNPYNTEEIANAMEKVLDKEIRQQLIEKGFERNKIFSWEKSSEKVWNIITKLAH